MKIIQLSKSEVAQLLSELKLAESKASSGLWSLRVHECGESVKFKVNAFSWSPPMGQLDPQSEYALRKYPVECMGCGVERGHACLRGCEINRIQASLDKI